MLKRVFTIALLCVSATAHAEITGSLGTGFEFTTGKYGGTTSTNIWYIPVTGRIWMDDIFVGLTVPYIRVTSAGGVVTRGIGRLRTSTSTQTVTESGLGDVIASAGYTFFENDELALELVGNIKFGTADAAKNLGTGENDYSVQVDADYDLESVSLFGTAGYKKIGAPEGIQLNNIAYGTLGFSKETDEETSAGLMLDAAQSSSELSPGTRELTVFISRRVSKTLRTEAHLMKGFSSGSPDFGGGASLTGMF